jgi:phosphopantetheinyl transferase
LEICRNNFAMPLFQEWSPNEHSLAAIWHIDEDEGFFSKKVRLISQIKHPRKRIEHLCGRYLLQHLREDFPLHHIAADEHDKPRVPMNRYFFSISHSYPFVAAVISDQEECGMDLQVWKDNIADIAHMFLSEEETALCGGDKQLLTLAWSAKEAAYKWYGRRGAEFIRDLPILGLVGDKLGFSAQELPASIYIDMSCYGIQLAPKCMLYKDFALAHVILHRPEAHT